MLNAAVVSDSSWMPPFKANWTSLPPDCSKCSEEKQEEDHLWGSSEIRTSWNCNSKNKQQWDLCQQQFLSLHKTQWYSKLSWVRLLFWKGKQYLCVTPRICQPLLWWILTAAPRTALSIHILPGSSAIRMICRHIIKSFNHSLSIIHSIIITS